MTKPFFNSSSCVPENQCKTGDGLLDVRGAGGEASCEDTSQICCYQENLISETEIDQIEAASPPDIEADKETPSEEYDYYDTILCSSLASEGYRYVQTHHFN